MEAQEIVKLTPESIQELLSSQLGEQGAGPRREQRRNARWPFPGAVEVWLPETTLGEPHMLATLHNLSTSGLAMSTQRSLTSGTRIEIAIHLPEMTCFGAAIVRHCTHSPESYLVGVEFIFDAEEPEDEDSD